MKINKLFFGLLAVAGLLFTACHENDDDDYKRASVSGEQVYFDNSLASRIDLEKNETSFTIPVKRINTSSAISVPLKVVCDSAEYLARFAFPSSVNFNAGQAESSITVTYNGDDFQYDYFGDMELIVGDEPTAYSTPYGKNIYKFAIGVPSPLRLLGIATFLEGFWFEDEFKVELYQNTEHPEEFRLKDPFGIYADQGLDGNQSEWLTFTVLKPGNAIGDVTITQNDLVWFDDVNTGYFHPTYSADVWMLHPGRFTDVSENDFVHNRVLSYQENGLPGQVQLAPRYYMFGVGGWNQSAVDGVVIITFPDYIPLDMEAEMHYLGIFTNKDEEVFAVAQTKLGKDAADVRAVVVPADADPDAVADAVAAGELEATPVEAGRIEVPISEDMNGKLQIVLMMFYEGKVMNIVTVPFEYYGGGKSPWESLGTGLYTEDFVLSAYGLDPVTYEVEIQENTETPGLYRMVSPYMSLPGITAEDLVDPSQPFNIEIDATNPNAVILYEQPIGLDFGYGPMTICSWGAYMLNNYDFELLNQYGYFGKVIDGNILLPTFKRYDQEDNPMFDEEGNPMIYQGLMFDDDGGYYAGTNGAFKVVLPKAVSSQAKAKAKKMAKANAFIHRLTHSGVKVNKKAARREMNRRLPITKMEVAK